MKWTTPQFSREEINKAGAALLDASIVGYEMDDVLDVVNDWRAAHAYPLQSIYVTLNSRSIRVDKSAITAQRRKRLASIVAKLRREPNMKLTQMADIGGCRAILTSMAELEKLVSLYKKAKSKNPDRHEEIRVRDYIANPKPDGYRGIHLIYKYNSKSAIHSVFNGQKIEIQIRTKLQHAWATAVEIVDAFTGQGLKSGLKLNLGDPDWRRFFVLMSSVIAQREKCPVVDGAPTNMSDLKRELSKLSQKLKVDEILSGLKAALENVPKDTDAVSYLLVLNSSIRKMKITPFYDHQAADEAYSKAEKDSIDKPEILAVLVSVESIKSLRTAYPNYYLDATEFLKILKKAIE